MTKRRSSGTDEGKRAINAENFAPPTRDRSNRDDTATARKRSTGGFASFTQKRRANSDFATEFRPETGEKILIKVLDAEPFDVYNQHWVDEGSAAGKTRHSFVCRDDEYFPDNDGCPLDDIGHPAATYSLFNILDLSVPDKPNVVVWRTTPTVTDKLQRLSQSDRTSPLNREDLYFEVEVIKSKSKTEWTITPVKSRDLKEDHGVEPLASDELAEFEKDKFEDRTVIIKVDSYDELTELVASLDG